jgi:hypothetical protein
VLAGYAGGTHNSTHPSRNFLREGGKLLLPFPVLRRARGERRGAEQHRFYFPLKLPLDSARRAPWMERGYNFSSFNAETNQMGNK